MAQAAAASFYRPAEWDRQSRTILAWPGQNEFFADNPEDLKAATEDVFAIVEAVALFEPVTLLVGTDRLQEAEKRFRKSKQVKLLPIDGYKLDLWMRDMAPVYVVNDDDKAARMYGVDFNFNGWGNKYPVESCVSLASKILDDMNVERVASSLVTEGGSLEVDGEGTLLITESSILNDNRNPGKSRQDVEAELRRTLGVEKIIWIPGRKGLEITDSHVDGLVRFVSPGKVLLSKPSELDDSVWTKMYDEAYGILSNSTDAKNRRFEIVEIAEADMYSIGLDRKTLKDIESGKEDSPSLSYVNYLLVNGGVIFPQFGDKNADAAALKVIRKLYGKDRDIEPVFIEELPMLGGGIHCSTQEVPVPKD